MFKRILVAHDGSDGAWETFGMGVDLALEASGALHVACIEGDRHLYAEQPDEVRDTNAESDSHLGGLDIETTVWPGHAVKAIIDLTSKEAFDLLVVGDTGHSSIYELLSHGPFHKLRGLAPRSILIVK